MSYGNPYATSYDDYLRRERRGPGFCEFCGEDLRPGHYCPESWAAKTELPETEEE